MRVLASFGARPRSASSSRSRASAAWACCRDLHTTSRSSAKRTKTPYVRVSQSRSSRFRYTLHIKGLITPPTQWAMSGMVVLRVGVGGGFGVVGGAFADRDTVPDGDLVGSDENVFDE